MQSREVPQKIAGVKCKEGRLGGSGLWSVKHDFFDKIGLLQLKNFIGASKRYDQSYWHLVEIYTGGKSYILGLDHRLGVHCGSLSYSVCNVLTRTKMSLEEAEEQTDKYIGGLSFEEFYNAVSTDEALLKEW
jgi:hypothetical protein